MVSRTFQSDSPVTAGATRRATRSLVFAAITAALACTTCGDSDALFRMRGSPNAYFCGADCQQAYWQDASLYDRRCHARDADAIASHVRVGDTLSVHVYASPSKRMHFDSSLDLSRGDEKNEMFRK